MFLNVLNRAVVFEKERSVVSRTLFKIEALKERMSMEKEE